MIRLKRYLHLLIQLYFIKKTMAKANNKKV